MKRKVISLALVLNYKPSRLPALPLSTYLQRYYREPVYFYEVLHSATWFFLYIYLLSGNITHALRASCKLLKALAYDVPSPPITLPFTKILVGASTNVPATVLVKTLPAIVTPEYGMYTDFVTFCAPLIIKEPPPPPPP